MITFKQINLDQTVLTAEGVSIAQSGSHEYRVWSALPPPTAEQGLTAKEIEAQVGKDTAKVGQGKAMKNRWIVKKGDGFLKAVSPVLALCLLPCLCIVGCCWRATLNLRHHDMLQVDQVEDVTQKDLLAIQSTGSQTDEKLLAELRKRKLVEKKYVTRTQSLSVLFRRITGLASCC